MLYAPPANFKDTTMRQRIETAVLNFRYWIDTDGPAGGMMVWTENHQSTACRAGFFVCFFWVGGLT